LAVDWLQEALGLVKSAVLPFTGVEERSAQRTKSQLLGFSSDESWQADERQR